LTKVVVWGVTRAKVKQEQGTKGAYTTVPPKIQPPVATVKGGRAKDRSVTFVELPLGSAAARKQEFGSAINDTGEEW
jgi:hypothetical protein